MIGSLIENSITGRILMMNQASFRSRKGYLCAQATEILAPFLRVCSRWHCGTATPKSTWRKGLLMGANHIGDILYRSSSLAQLAKGMPECNWDILAPKPASQTLEGNPSIRKIHPFGIPLIGSPNFKKLLNEAYDVVICYDTGMYTHALLTASLLGIPNRIGYIHKGCSGLVTHPIQINYPQPFPAYFRDLVSQVTGQEPNWNLRPKIFLTDRDAEEADAFWNALNLSNDKPVLACFVTSRQPTGVWPLEMFRATLELIHASCKAQFLLCGAPEDMAKLEQLRATLSFPSSINAGLLGLRALVALLSKCSVVLSTDSGPRHLANAAGAQVVFMRNSWFSRIEAGTYCHDTEHDMASNVEFLIPSQQDLHIGQSCVESVAKMVVSLLNSKRP
jgi:ADP-heptose:LPS heptosyltransferase